MTIALKWYKLDEGWNNNVSVISVIATHFVDRCAWEDHLHVRFDALQLLFQSRGVFSESVIMCYFLVLALIKGGHSIDIRFCFVLLI